MRLLMDYDWPGNVRELENAIERAVVTSKDRVLTEDDFRFLQAKQETRGVWIPPNLTLQDIEKEAITAAIRRTGGNIKEAAVGTRDRPFDDLRQNQTLRNRARLNARLMRLAGIGPGHRDHHSAAPGVVVRGGFQASTSGPLSR